MPSYPPYEDLSQRAEAALGFAVFLARSPGSKQPDVLIKAFRPGQLVAFDEPPEEELARYKQQFAAFYGSAEVSATRSLLRPIQTGENDGEFWWAVPFYGNPRTGKPNSLRSVTQTHLQLTADQLHNVVTGIVRGLRELHHIVGRGHGNLRLSNVFFRSLNKSSDIYLADPALNRAPDPREDLRALGEIIYQLVIRQEITNQADWPTPPLALSKPWQLLGKAAQQWLGIAERLLDEHFDLEQFSLEDIQRELDRIKPPAAIKKPALFTAVGALAIVAITIGLLLRPPKGPNSAEDGADPELVTLVLRPNVASARLTVNGADFQESQIRVPKGQVVRVEASAVGYNSIETQVVASADMPLDLLLVPSAPVPPQIFTVRLLSEVSGTSFQSNGAPLAGNQVTGTNGQVIRIQAIRDGYLPYNTNLVVTADRSLNVALAREALPPPPEFQVTFTNNLPNAAVTYMAGGSAVQFIRGPRGREVEVRAQAPGYNLLPVTRRVRIGASAGVERFEFQAARITDTNLPARLELRRIQGEGLSGSGTVPPYLRPGKYSIELLVDGQVKSAVLEAKNQEQVRLRDHLLSLFPEEIIPSKFQLIAEADPPNALIEVGGRPYDGPLNLGLGQHILTAALEGVGRATNEVVVTQPGVQKIRIRIPHAKLDASRLFPPNGKFFVNEKEVSSAIVSTGRHTIRYEAPGHDPFTQTNVLLADAVTYPVSATNLWARIVLESDVPFNYAVVGNIEGSGPAKPVEGGKYHFATRLPAGPTNASPVIALYGGVEQRVEISHVPKTNLIKMPPHVIFTNDIGSTNLIVNGKRVKTPGLTKVPFAKADNYIIEFGDAGKPVRFTNDTPLSLSRILELMQPTSPPASPSVASTGLAPPVVGKWTNSLGMEFVWVEPLKVWVGKHEVSREQFEKVVPALFRQIETALEQAFTGEAGHIYKGYELNASPSKPVTMLTGLEALMFCETLGKSENLNYDLPRIAEFQQFGLRASQEFTRQTAGRKVQEVRLGEPNQFGLLNAFGNVREFCWHNADPGEVPESGEAQGDSFAGTAPAPFTKVAASQQQINDLERNPRSPHVGFRVVLRAGKNISQHSPFQTAQVP